MLEVHGVHYTYEGADAGPALRGVSLSVAPGEFVALLGANGSGKSTLAKLMAGLLLPQSGAVVVDGFATSDRDRDPVQLRRLVGMVFQNPDNQIIGSTVLDDLAFGPENLGLPREETRQRVAAALELLGVANLEREEPHRLSGGQKQRVAIAAAVAMGPRYLILDEPTALLDPSGRREVRGAIQRLRREQGMGLILITHFMDEAALADRIVVLSRGEVAMAGPPREVFARGDELRTLGLELPLVAQVTAGLRERGIAVPGDLLNLEELITHLCPSG